MKEWYCLVKGHRYGPIPETRLRELAATGRLGKDDLLWTEGMAEWTQASLVPGLFAVPADTRPVFTAPLRRLRHQKRKAFITREKEAVKEFFDAFLKLRELKDCLLFLWSLLPIPVERIMEVVKGNETGYVRPFRFMAFGFSVFTLIQITTPIFGEQYKFLDSMLLLVLTVLALIVYLWITFVIFRRISNLDRTFDQFLRMSAILAGVNWTLLGVAGLAALIYLEAGLVLLGLVSIYTLIYSMKLYKRFWYLPYEKILLYTILVAFFSGVVFGIIGVLLEPGLMSQV